MRIIGGKYRSRKVYSIAEPKNCIKGNFSGYRPTTDRARESLFNILNNLIDFDKTSCLDLFAGSGAVGFEMLSRGAAKVDFVENSTRQAAIINKTVMELDCQSSINIFEENALTFLNRNAQYYDIIFADPPYTYGNYDELINIILKREFSIFAIEHSGNLSFDISADKFDIIKRNTGVTHFLIFSTKEN